MNADVNSSVFTRVNPWLLFFLGAALFALAFPPFDVWFLAPIAPAPFALAAIGSRTSRTAMIAAFVTQFLMWLWLLKWIIPVTPIGYPALAAYMSVWPMLLVWIIRRVCLHSTLGRWPMTIVLPVAWTAMEYFRGDVLFHGYPWYFIAHPLIAWPVIVQSADLFGTYFVSFIAAMIAGVVVDVCRLRLCDQKTFSRPIVTSAIAVIIVVTFNVAYGAWRMKQTESLSEGPRMLSIQTSVPLDIKHLWTPEDQWKNLQEFMALTRDAIASANAKPDIVIWPETMVPGIGFEDQTINTLQQLHDEGGWRVSHLYRLSLEMFEFQRSLDVPMIVGSECWTDAHHSIEDGKLRFNPSRTYNSAYLLNGDQPHQRYDKFFLTPFGETMPYISAWPWLEQQLLNIGVSADMAFNLDSNPDVNLLELQVGANGEQSDRSYLIATPICFEDTVARYCRRMIYREGEKVVDVIGNISNDGWFNKADTDRILHAMIARFRAIENRVPMVRSVNTGMSLWIDSCGRIIAKVGNGGQYGTPRQAGWIAADVQVDSRVTLYGKVGELWPFACLIATLSAVGYTIVARRTASS